MNSVGSPVCLSRQSELEKLWLDGFAQQHCKTNGSAPFLGFMGWQWKSLRHLPKVQLDWTPLSFHTLLRLSCIVRIVTARNQNCPTAFPSGTHPSACSQGRGAVTMDGKLKMKVASAIRHPDAGYNWWFYTVVVSRLEASKTMGRIYGFSKEKSKYRLQQLARGRTAHCTVLSVAGKYSSRVTVGNSLSQWYMKCLYPAADPPQQPVSD